MIDSDGFDHCWVPCDEDCPPGLHCGWCACGDKDCELMDEDDVDVADMQHSA